MVANYGPCNRLCHAPLPWLRILSGNAMSKIYVSNFDIFSLLWWSCKHSRWNFIQRALLVIFAVLSLFKFKQGWPRIWLARIHSSKGTASGQATPKVLGSVSFHGGLKRPPVLRSKTEVLNYQKEILNAYPCYWRDDWVFLISASLYTLPPVVVCILARGDSAPKVNCCWSFKYR